MILQALNQYYERKQASAKGELPPYEFERKKIPVIIEIDTDGNLIQIIIRDEKDPSASELVPHSVKRSVNIEGNLLWDNVEYALGIDTRGNPKRVVEQHQSFRNKIFSLDTNDVHIQAVMKFLDKIDRDSIQKGHQMDILKSNPDVSFRIAGEPHLICQKPELAEIIANINQSDTTIVDCLVTGKKDRIERVHPAIKGVWGAQSSGGNIVSFNKPSFESYGKSQGENSPVGKKASFAYTTALNHLLRKGSEQRFQVGDSSTVFWAENNPEFETTFGGIFSPTPKDDPDAYTLAVKALYVAPRRGQYQASESADRFYVLGLSPNAARISIRFWQVATVAEISERIKQHFDDLRMTHSERDMPYLPLFFLLKSMAALGKSENIPPNLAGEVMQSILTGRPYPQTMLSVAIRRCKAEQEINYPRAAIIKACINRFQSKEELKVTLDVENTNPAYRLGRLFAVLEKIQEEANPGINATIRNRYYGAASSNPVSVFSTLLKLKNHHLSKFEAVGRKIYFEKLIGEIMCEIPPDLPASLNLQDQGRFAVGYYHQRQDFFTRKSTKQPEEQS